MNLEYKEIVDTLKGGIFNVTFTKVDGTDRVMRCTLMADSIPATPKSDKPRKPNYSVVSVYDLGNAGWRSFRVNSVISIEKAD